jgi:regulator of nucleoside diphosphate kinase
VNRVNPMIVAKESSLSNFERNTLNVGRLSSCRRRTVNGYSHSFAQRQETACFLLEKIERADVAPDDVAPRSAVKTRL